MLKLQLIKEIHRNAKIKIPSYPYFHLLFLNPGNLICGRLCSFYNLT